MTTPSEPREPRRELEWREEMPGLWRGDLLAEDGTSLVQCEVQKFFEGRTFPQWSASVSKRCVDLFAGREICETLTRVLDGEPRAERLEMLREMISRLSDANTDGTMTGAINFLIYGDVHGLDGEPREPGCPTNCGAFTMEPKENWGYAARLPGRYRHCPDCGAKLGSPSLGGNRCPHNRVEMLAHIDHETVGAVGTDFPLTWSPICRDCGDDVPARGASLKGTE